uniref:Transmembrane protein n=1 Tax=Fagus sylvatica TaxID=28930 RepID=A0A2N9J8B7_FAGSY
MMGPTTSVRGGSTHLISKRRGLGGYGVVDAGVFFGLGGYGVGLVTAWWLRRGLGGYGVVVTAWAWWLRRGGSARETHGSKIFFFSQQHHLKPPATTRRDPRMFSQIWTHRGQPPPRRDPRRGSLLRSVTTEATP